jgi:3-methylcrotonyl-CoA carboxylase beta subunit
MSAPTLTTTLNPDSPEAQARAAHNRALAAELRAMVVEAALSAN